MKSSKIVGSFVLILVAICLIPSVVSASAYDDLVKTKEYTIKSIEPSNQDFVYTLAEVIEEEMRSKYDGWYLDFNNCNENYTQCKLTKMDENQMIPIESDFDVKINYVYDKDIKKVVDSLKNKLDKDSYNLTDLDYFNWKISYLTNVDDAINKGNSSEVEEPSLVMFSSEFKKNIGYKNFILDVRLGDDFPLYKEHGGQGVFKYNDTIYYVTTTPIRASYNHLFYVDSNATDMEKAVKTRLESNFNHKFVVENSQQTVENFLINTFKSEFDAGRYPSEQYQSANEYAEAQLNALKNEIDHPYHYLASYLNEYVYIIEFDYENVKDKEFIIPIKNSTKITKAEFKSNDISSDISISTDSVIPLDTLIKVAKITSGNEYDKIVKILGSTNIQMFDLKLFSTSINNYITKLDNGSFEVKIPIAEELKGKELIVFYVDDDNNIIEHEVIIEDGYAKFYTDHFSIYTLAEMKNTSTSNNLVDNPKTADNIVFSIGLFIISTILIGGSVYYRKKHYN